ncbi:hypothetical protein GCM10009760_54460 [Kitasatospora kazusensis]|uniref:Uncharacterized protein n=1 Tax=Kitasatospora kazusensis TaxID=407974 RepID=A0ABP5M070_9ACTN
MLALEAEQQIQSQVWELTPGDHALALEAEAGLRKAVGLTDAQEGSPEIERLFRERSQPPIELKRSGDLHRL